MQEPQRPRGNRNPILSFIFVTVQFVALGLIFATGPLFPDNPLLLGVELLGLFLGVWAVLSMGIGNFGVAPTPLSWSRLVTRGPYEMIRHPMYLSLLLLTLPLVIAEFSFPRLFIWLLLLIDLVMKLHYEESLLAVEVNGYAEYMKKSNRLIPFIY